MSRHSSSDVRNEIDNTIGYQSLHYAITKAERTGAGILRYVEPQNLLFFFGQTIQALFSAPMDLNLGPQFLGERKQIINKHYNDNCCGNDKDKSNNRAFIFCKFIDTDFTEKFFTEKKHRCRNNAEYYEVTWSELKEIKKASDDFCNHDNSSFCKNSQGEQV
jgi:hypothetical protein